mgnify:CR=1 FL=1
MDQPRYVRGSITSASTSGASLGSVTLANGTSAIPLNYAQDPRQFYGSALQGQQIGNFGSFQQAGVQMAAPAISKSKLRVVRVFLVDPDERIPLEKRILHRSEEMTTDATDQELFFGIPVQDLLKTHNAMRTAIKWKDADAKGEAEPLKEIRIRDLVMTVTTIAEFQSRPA